MAHSATNPVNTALQFPLADAFERDITRLLEQDESFTIAFIDLDQFDHVNKDFGRDEGDRVIIETGRYLRTAIAAEYQVYRYGGDEFAALFSGEIEKEDVFLLLENVRRGFCQSLPDGTSITISIGIATVPEDSSTYHDLVRKANGAMFRGKLLGRNRVCLAREEKMVPKTTHYTAEQLKRLTKVAAKEGAGEAVLLREALDMLLKKYDA